MRRIDNAAKTKQTAKQVFRNNLFLIRLCFSASPIYIITMTVDAARNQISIFFEHTYGIGYVLEAAEFHYPFRQVAAFLLILAACITLGMLFSVVVTDYLAVRELPKVRRRVKMALYQKAKELDLKCYDDPDYYNELVLAISEADKQIDRCVTFLQNTASGIAVFLSTGIYFFSKDKLSIVFAAVSFFLTFCFNQLYNRLTYEVRMKRNPFERKREYVKRVFYLSDYAKELRLNPQVSDILFDDFEKANNEIYRVEKKYANKRFFLSFLRRYVSNDFFSDVLYIAYLVFKAAVMHTLSYSSVAILYNSFGRMKKSMSLFTDVYPYASETSLYVQKIRDFLDYEPEIQSRKSLPVSDQAKALKLEHVSFAYNKQDGDVIHDVSLCVAQGEKIALVGYNGAGKTTLIKLIMRLYDTTEGVIFADGVDIRDYNVEKYRHSIGTVFQDFKIFAGTVTENVLLDLDKGTEDEKVRDSLCHSGLSERVKAFPHGLKTQLTTEFAKEGVNLSGGESQKLAIGRVFYKDAGLIILDEPSSALDPIAEYQLNHSMLEATENKTVIFISHRLSTTRLADRIILLKEGRIAEQGTHEELLLLNGWYAKMWRAQAGQYIEV
ncbi:MAG: ABC transporter ATP-binding protein [Suilimivivens sp.]